jgi:hypothetical protein
MKVVYIILEQSQTYSRVNESGGYKGIIIVRILRKT